MEIFRSLEKTTYRKNVQRYETKEYRKVICFHKIIENKASKRSIRRRARLSLKILDRKEA